MNFLFNLMSIFLMRPSFCSYRSSHFFSTEGRSTRSAARFPYVLLMQTGERLSSAPPPPPRRLLSSTFQCNFSTMRAEILCFLTSSAGGRRMENTHLHFATEGVVFRPPLHGDKRLKVAPVDPLRRDTTAFGPNVSVTPDAPTSSFTIIYL